MSNAHTTSNEPKGEAWASGDRSGLESASIRYEGAKQAKVPLPIVLVGVVVVVAAIIAARHLLGT